MHLPLSAATTPRLVVLPHTGSTNDDLRALAAEPDAVPFTAVVTGDQRAGRGRRGRDWSAPAGRSLAISVLLAPATPASGWIPLVAGLAVVEAVRAVLPADAVVALKWPNDPQVSGRKVSGVLAELLPDGRVVVGAGINLALGAEELPTPVSTSLLLEGATLAGDALADAVLSGYLRALRALAARLDAARGDAGAAGIRALLLEECATVGRAVRVELPDGSALHGTATGIDADGRLLVAPDGAPERAVAAGDVTHLRYE
ncbi:biotin--[acetyl-CoA-carboxylase] ligase [Galbitalea sp. SE-J8]|uniref:biotin--[acetyl-CoA-carboxylase] ligase n=1 Tax=Galbitalea sp. SE-J8 TaxID=3054952 RepID=UPI00259C9BDA|nr:biotin--[acetyl-CoA-carboxylase] ligase [Galbitalea sp. SE-J8]MDM4762735.1 biotin--[acetyl-CoA-carboxylase] ligase [Galbitalea sp. SE-J8]